MNSTSLLSTRGCKISFRHRRRRRVSRRETNLRRFFSPQNFHLQFFVAPVFTNIAHAPNSSKFIWFAAAASKRVHPFIRTRWPCFDLTVSGRHKREPNMVLFSLSLRRFFRCTPGPMRAQSVFLPRKSLGAWAECNYFDTFPHSRTKKKRPAINSLLSLVARLIFDLNI
jgi:hypothetical protein